jgi:hypothetical protein
VRGEVSVEKGVIVTKPVQGSVAARLIAKDNTLFFKLESLSVLSNLLPIQLSKDWYKYDLADTEQGKCIKSGKGSSSLLGSQVLTDIPVKNTKFTGPGKFDGTNSLHFTGTVDNTRLKAAIDKANKELSADCKLGVSSDDFKNVSITYELWRGLARDRLKLNIVDAKSKTNDEITLDTAAYNQSVKIDAPAGAVDIKKYMENEAQKETTAAANDATRRADLAKAAAAAEQYAAAHKGVYPPTAGAFAPLVATLVEPQSGHPYVVTATGPPTAVGVIQYVRSARCQGNVAASISPANSKTYAVVMYLESGATVCTGK